MPETRKADEVADALAFLAGQFHSPNVLDSNLEPANVADTLYGIRNAVRYLAEAITADAGPGDCPSGNGNKVGCLTEAVMSVSSSLMRIAEAIERHGEVSP